MSRQKPSHSVFREVIGVRWRSRGAHPRSMSTVDISVIIERIVGDGQGEQSGKEAR